MNVQDNASLAGVDFGYNPTTSAKDPNGDALYWVAFTVDVSGLADGYSIHFDLYNTDVRDCRGKEACSTVVSADDFAPFSHDAQSGGDARRPPAAAAGDSRAGQFGARRSGVACRRIACRRL